MASATQDPATNGVVPGPLAAALAAEAGVSVERLALSLVPCAQEFAVVPVSSFKVGAVGVGRSGALYYGANLEFSGQALSSTVHAEQSCVANAWANGEEGLAFLAISAAPCGYCRQFLYELAGSGSLSILLPEQAPRPLADFLPDPFGPADLGLEGGLMQAQANGLVLEGEAGPAELAALAAANASYSPYTRTFAGVALRTSSGVTCTGRYAENAAFNPSMSPLQGALSQLILHGQSFDSIVEAVLVEAEGQASQVSATRSVLDAVTAVPLTLRIAVPAARGR
jgi:cytidine deaminase